MKLLLSSCDQENYKKIDLLRAGQIYPSVLIYTTVQIHAHFRNVQSHNNKYVIIMKACTVMDLYYT